MKVKLQGVRYRLPNFSLGPIDMDVESGKIYVVMGKNGSGKSTTLKLIHGDIRPSEGTVLIDGVDASKIGFIKLAKK
jgi:ABC-type cobalamin/Fe3+-siderophores transport systems, ATPase components